MTATRSLLFALLALGGSPLSVCWQQATSPRVENLTERDAKYANEYWQYNASERVVRRLRTDSSSVGGSQGGQLGYRFIVPLPERLAGLTYVGHAARLRLVLERARNGEALMVGALGGSITFGQAVGGWKGSYVQTFMDWLNAALSPHRAPRALFGTAQTLGIAAAAPPPPPAAAATAAAVAVAADGNEAAAAARSNGLGSGGVAGATDGNDEEHSGCGGGGGGGVPKRRVAQEALEAPAGARAPSSGTTAAAATEEAAEPAVILAGGNGTGSGSRPLRQSKHDYFNGAVPGTTSAYMSSCLNHHLPPAVDLVFVEYAANDSPAPRWTFADPARRAMERLIRKLLRLPSRPAVVLVNMYAISAAHGKYLHTAERDFAELATYYSLPSVSLKAAVMPSAAVGGAEAVSHGAIFNGGHNHPGRGGHVVVTELLITLCLGLLRSDDDDNAGCDPWGASAVDAVGGDEAAAATTTTTAAAAAAVMEAVAARPLPPPLADHNYESSESMCYIEHELQALVQQPVEGWEWTEEARGKWGYVAMEPEKALRIKVGTLLAGNRSEKQAAAPVVVQIAYLQSYHGMGVAVLRCMEGCSCKPVKIDAHNPRPVSLTAMEDVQVSQHPQCVLTLTTKGPSQAAVAAARDAARNETSTSGGDGGGRGGSGGPEDMDIPSWSKFKLLGVVVGEEPGASEGGVTWLRDESHEMANAMHTMGASERAG